MCYLVHVRRTYRTIPGDGGGGEQGSHSCLGIVYKIYDVIPAGLKRLRVVPFDGVRACAQEGQARGQRQGQGRGESRKSKRP